MARNQLTRDLTRIFHEHPDMIDVYVTQDDQGWIGIALTEDEALTLLSVLEPALDPTDE